MSRRGAAVRGSHHHGHETGAHASHGHSHGLVDRSIMRSRAGLRAVGLSLAILALTALVQDGSTF